MPTIDTLIPDIYKLLETKGWFTDDVAAEFGNEVSKRMQTHFTEREHIKAPRLSKLEFECPRAYWYSIHHPELAEPLPAPAVFKYAYGHIIEALAITCAKAAGHTVEGEQDAVQVAGVTGHRDCIIDGCLCDVKSASSFSFKKFKDKSLATSDSFGYLAQLDAYLAGSLDDDRLSCKDRAYDLAIDKQLGHMCLYEHKYRGYDFIRQRIERCNEIVGRNQPPACQCSQVPDGKSGNIKLDTIASYSSYKFCCFPNLRTFLYSSGPVYLTKVVRTPDVTEVNRDGKVVYH